MHDLLFAAADTVDPGTNTTVIGLIISGVTAVAVAVIARWQKRRRPVVLTPAESAANLNFVNQRDMLAALRTEFEKYKTEREASDREAERNENDYRRQVGTEINEFRRQLAYKDLVIDLLNNEAIDLRIWAAAGAPPPPPPRAVRPPQTFGPSS